MRSVASEHLGDTRGAARGHACTRRTSSAQAKRCSLRRRGGRLARGIADPVHRAATLVQGTSYWLVGACTETTQGFWHQNDQGLTGSRAVLNVGLPWAVDARPLAAFRVEVGPASGGCAADLDGNGAVQPADLAQ